MLVKRIFLFQAKLGLFQVALLLIRHGANVDAEDNEGYTVLGRAPNDLRPALIDAAKAMLEE